MTLEEIREFVVSIDPNAQRYESSSREGDYTVWGEYSLLPITANGRHVGGWRFQVDRFTRNEDDELTAAFLAALDASPRISFHYEVSYERDTRYIHHIFDCEAV